MRTSSNRRIAAIHGDRAARHPARLVGGEKQHRPYEIVELAQPAGRDQRLSSPPRLGIGAEYRGGVARQLIGLGSASRPRDQSPFARDPPYAAPLSCHHYRDIERKRCALISFSLHLPRLLSLALMPADGSLLDRKRYYRRAIEPGGRPLSAAFVSFTAYQAEFWSLTRSLARGRQLRSQLRSSRPRDANTIFGSIGPLAYRTEGSMAFSMLPLLRRLPSDLVQDYLASLDRSLRELVDWRLPDRIRVPMLRDAIDALRAAAQTGPPPGKVARPKRKPKNTEG